MTICAQCRRDNADGIEFCAGCGRILWSGAQTAQQGARPRGDRTSAPPTARGGADTGGPGSPADPAASPGRDPMPGPGRQRAPGPRQTPAGVQPDGQPAPPRGPGAGQDAQPGTSRAAGGRIRVRRDTHTTGLRAVPIAGLFDDDDHSTGTADGYRGVRPDEQPLTATSTFGPSSDWHGAGTGTGTAGSQVRCRCGRQNPPGSRFCPCGQTLVHDQTGSPADTAPGTTPGPRPALAGAGERRRFDRQMRAAAGGRRGYDRPLANRVVALRATAGLLAVAVVLALAGPASGSTRGWAAGRISGVLPHSYKEVDVSGVGVTPAQRDLRGYPPMFAVDGYRNRAWVTAWNPDEAIGETCSKTVGRSAILVLTFARSVRIDHVSIRAGLPKDDPAAPSQVRPKRIAIQFGDEQCQFKDLLKVAEPQLLNVTGKDTQLARVWIVDAYDAATAPGNQVAISEIDFLVDA
ncbi:hypothetical protein [Frankia gtarii]|uniref:hypothetical protein n=1 Tax=Frankia gtarii TaxID=2950102 RepID=UPI0021C0B8D0|nr:hypothetical protein [Frankia gtarii]